MVVQRRRAPAAGRADGGGGRELSRLPPVGPDLRRRSAAATTISARASPTWTPTASTRRSSTRACARRARACSATTASCSSRACAPTTSGCSSSAPVARAPLRPGDDPGDGRRRCRGRARMGAARSGYRGVLISTFPNGSVEPSADDDPFWARAAGGRRSGRAAHRQLSRRRAGRSGARFDPARGAAARLRSASRARTRSRWSRA